MNYKKVFESWELEDRAAQPKEFGNRKKSSKRYYKRMASKAVRRYNVAIIATELEGEDDFEQLIALKAALVAKRDMLIEALEELDVIIDSLSI